MKLLVLTLACPQCGSHDVVYSCDPDCCFNHVCGNCHTSFEPITRALGQTLAVVDVAPQERDSCASTVACARCRSLEVYMVASNTPAPQQLVCASCHSLLELGFSYVTPG